MKKSLLVKIVESSMLNPISDFSKNFNRARKRLFSAHDHAPDASPIVAESTHGVVPEHIKDALNRVSDLVSEQIEQNHKKKLSIINEF